VLECHLSFNAMLLFVLLVLIFIDDFEHEDKFTMAAKTLGFC
jgi:hypothetical protein